MLWTIDLIFVFIFEFVLFKIFLSLLSFLNKLVFNIEFLLFKNIFNLVLSLLNGINKCKVGRVFELIFFLILFNLLKFVLC